MSMGELNLKYTQNAAVFEVKKKGPESSGYVKIFI